MIRIRQIKIPVFEDQDIEKRLISLLKIKIDDIVFYKINKKSLDARKKPNLFYVYEVDVQLRNEKLIKKNNYLDVEVINEECFSFDYRGDKKLNSRPIIVGSGPSGLFCAYHLAKYGLKPIVIEQGEPMEKRIKTVDEFFQTGKLNSSSNIQFGEGGAGTFSDGKLNTSVKKESKWQKLVLETFISCGAPEEIGYLNKPHIGTDELRKVIVNLRNKIISLGGEFCFNTKLIDLNVEDNIVKSITTNKCEMETSILVLAIGHSSRDTFRLLNSKKVFMEPKPFAVGLRVLHSQDMINKSQYGIVDSRLPMADYKLTFNHNERGVYTFCMCPGGYVVNSSSENNRLVINGMSNHKRDSGIANSAVVVTVNPNDYGEDLFAGVNYQEKLESAAYKLCNGSIPTQLYGDFKNNKASLNLGNINPQVKGSYKLTNIRTILPDYITDSFILGMEDFGKKIKGFNDPDTILMGIESRTSSPIRINRDNDYKSNIANIYPIGEGAGYAGGIMTSAIDGLKVADKILNIYKL